MIAQYFRHVGVLSTIEEQVRSARRRFDRFPVPSKPITVFPGSSVWCAMLARQPHQLSRSNSPGYQKPFAASLGLRIA